MLLHRLGAFVHRRARLVLAVSAVLIAVAALLGFGAFGKLQGGGFEDPASDSAKAAARVDAQFGGHDNLVFLVTAKGAGRSADSPAVAREGAALTRALTADRAGVDRVTSYWATHAPELRSTDGRSALVLVHVNGDTKQATATAKQLIADHARDTAAAEVRAGSSAAVNVQLNQQVARSLAVAESIAVPVILVLLLLAFGSVVAALLPLALGGIAILATFFELFVLGSVTDVSVYAISLTTQLGLGLGIDYALLLVSRYREQRRQGDSVEQAVSRTTATAGRTILFSAATLAVAMTALLIFPQFFLRSFAYAGIGVALLAALAALFIVPALLTVLGDRIEKGRLPWSLSGRGEASPGWRRLTDLVTRRPLLTGLPVLAVLLLAAAPLLGVAFGSPDETVLRSGMTARQVSTALATDFRADAANTLDVVSTGPVAPARAAEFGRTLNGLDGVARVTVQQTAQGDHWTVAVRPAAASDRAQHLVHEIRALPGPGTGTLVGGATAVLVDNKSSIGGLLPWAVGMVVVLTFALLFLFTGSVLQPLRALLVNGLGLTATLGAMTWVFQGGHLASLLDVTPRPMDTSMSVLLLIVAFGLSMDYEVFLTSRVKELHDQGADTRTAVVEGMARTGRIVSTAAALLAVAMFAFTSSTVGFLQMFGLGAGLAVLLDATLIRGVLVPAVTALVGERIWWAPRPLRLLHERIGLSESGPEPDAPEPATPVTVGR